MKKNPKLNYEHLDSYVIDFLEARVDKVEMTLKLIELARERLAPMQHLLSSIEAFAKTPDLPPTALDGFDNALREVIDGAQFDWRRLREQAYLACGRGLLEPTTPGGNMLKPIGYVKKDWKWEPAS